MKASEFAGLIPECCTEVLDAMYFTTVVDSRLEESMPEAMPDETDFLSFHLRFVGHISGRFGLHMARGLARNLAANFLGEEESDISSAESEEVAGELTNMLCGSVMSRVEGEDKFILSHPEPGSLELRDGVDDVLISRLDTDSGVLTVWVVVEGEPCLL
jgi:hypothetical protein